jgi:hypothetical protein
MALVAATPLTSFRHRLSPIRNPILGQVSVERLVRTCAVTESGHPFEQFWPLPDLG